MLSATDFWFHKTGRRDLDCFTFSVRCALVHETILINLVTCFCIRHHHIKVNGGRGHKTLFEYCMSSCTWILHSGFGLWGGKEKAFQVQWSWGKQVRRSPLRRVSSNLYPLNHHSRHNNNKAIWTLLLDRHFDSFIKECHFSRSCHFLFTHSIRFLLTDSGLGIIWMSYSTVVCSFVRFLSTTTTCSVASPSSLA